MKKYNYVVIEIDEQDRRDYKNPMTYKQADNKRDVMWSWEVVLQDEEGNLYGLSEGLGSTARPFHPEAAEGQEDWFAEEIYPENRRKDWSRYYMYRSSSVWLMNPINIDENHD